MEWDLDSAIKEVLLQFWVVEIPCEYMRLYYLKKRWCVCLCGIKGLWYLFTSLYSSFASRFSECTWLLNSLTDVFKENGGSEMLSQEANSSWTEKWYYQLYVGEHFQSYLCQGIHKDNLFHTQQIPNRYLRMILLIQNIFSIHKTFSVESIII